MGEPFSLFFLPLLGDVKTFMKERHKQPDHRVPSAAFGRNQKGGFWSIKRYSSNLVKINQAI